MALVEKTPQPEEDVPEPTSVTLDLDADAHRLLLDLTRRTGWDASELVGWALGAYWREMEGITLAPAQTWSEADLVDIREGIAQADRGGLVPQDVVEKEIAELLSRP